MRTYLSIDLDYFHCAGFTPIDEDLVNKRFDVFIDWIVSLNMKPKFVESHEQLLDHINETSPDKILHIDTHSDIAFTDPRGNSPKLNDGTFMFFVEGKRNIEYEWRLPDRVHCIRNKAGICDCEGWPTVKMRKQDSGWKKLSYKAGLSGIKNHEIASIGFAFSPEWTHFNKFEESSLSKLVSMMDESEIEIFNKVFDKQDIRANWRKNV